MSKWDREIVLSPAENPAIFKARTHEVCWTACVWGGADVIRYSALDPINRKNVKDLKVAWTFDFGDSTPASQIESSPLMIDNIVYLISPRAKVAALDAATGKLLWKFDPMNGAEGQGRALTRGFSYWMEG